VFVEGGACATAQWHNGQSKPDHGDAFVKRQAPIEDNSYSTSMSSATGRSTPATGLTRTRHDVMKSRLDGCSGVLIMHSSSIFSLP